MQRLPLSAARISPNWAVALHFFLAASLAGQLAAASSHPATIREYDRVFITYAYSDPNPVPAMSRFYPYFHYDGYTDKPVPRAWKVVELANDYLQVLILPEIGGKIWTAIDKTTGRPFIYFNPVVKFRDVSMRGPWTSGGIEANYGIMGHTPNCFSPVDYLTRRNPDGSASCFIGVLDLLTRTSWRLEINLAANEAVFSTRSFWHNGSGSSQPYYTWMNAGLKSAGNLELISPGTHFLGHDGRASAWPINPANGRDLSWYEQNNFGSYKSYHVFGRLAEFFGGYWHDDDFGMAHCAPYGDKPGRKFWIWGLSREGMIWENLLTDGAGQYVEVQSGRFFNQADEASGRTPFKHYAFAPYATDTWTEHWLPVRGIKGFVTASPWGALNVTNQAERLVIRISPARPLRDKLEVFDGDRLLCSRTVTLRPLQPVEETVPLANDMHQLRVCVGGDKLQYLAGEAEALTRPMEAPPSFDWSSLYGLYLKGQESARQRAYPRAAAEFQACLIKDPNFLPALVELADLAGRRGDAVAAREFAQRALAIDTYDAGANYQFGLASAALGQSADAKAAFSLTALAMGWRNAANVELAKEFLREKLYDRALASAQESLDANRHNLDAFQLCACVSRLRGDGPGAEAALKSLLALDPLNHFARCERFLRGQASREEFTRLIRNELPHETFLELAAWYRGVGRDQDAARVLAVAPSQAEVLYWRAYLARDTGLLARANAAAPDLVFPFRPESIPVFAWAREHGRAWQPNYYLALIRWHQGELAPARQLLEACGQEPRFAPFYAARASLSNENAARDLQTAAELDPGQWRYGALLARFHLERQDPAAALTVAADYARRFPTNATLTLLHAKTLLLSDQPRLAAQLLDSLHLLPSEGATDARGLFHEAHLLLALERFRARQFDEALHQLELACQWPERLGSGKPYPEAVDERVEDWLAYHCHRARGSAGPARQALEKVLAFRPSANVHSAGDVARTFALKDTGRVAAGEQLLKDWLAQDPQSETARWALDVLAGRKGPVPSSLRDLGLHVLAGCLEHPE